MSNPVRNQKRILEKLKIEALNEMQNEAQLAIHTTKEVILLSPTGTGKTLAFTLPMIASLDIELKELQAMVIVPTRELAIQIEQYIKEMGTGFKVNAVYGGRSVNQDKIDLKVSPQIIIGTPGRLADHLRRDNILTEHLQFLVLDEFDKALEIGFEDEMSEILYFISPIKKKVLTSATDQEELPDFIGMNDAVYVDYLDQKKSTLEIKLVESPEKDKIQTLVDLLQHIGNQPGIIFCNYRDSIQRISEHLEDNNISHASFYGGLEQQDRERALIKFRNGTHQLLLATDLAARGIDVPDIQFIIHYHLPFKKEEFTHRNGRTARMKKEGKAYVLKWKEEALPDFIKDDNYEPLDNKTILEESPFATVFISGGRRDKISKGDIVGLLGKQAGLNKDEIGAIELKQDCAFVAISKKKLNSVLQLSPIRLKKRKVQLKEI